MTVKERLHRTVDELSDQEAETLLRRVEALRGGEFPRYLDAAVPSAEELPHGSSCA
jgi:hypothetical protein